MSDSSRLSFSEKKPYAVIIDKIVKILKGIEAFTRVIEDDLTRFTVLPTQGIIISSSGYSCFRNCDPWASAML